MEKFLWSQGEGSERVPELRMTGNGTESERFAARFILVRFDNLQNCPGLKVEKSQQS